MSDLSEEVIVASYEPPPPDLSLDEQIQHARGFASGICRDDHHVSRLLVQMARSIEVLGARDITLTAEVAKLRAEVEGLKRFEGAYNLAQENTRLLARVKELESLQLYAEWSDANARVEALEGLLRECEPHLRVASTRELRNRITAHLGDAKP